MGLIKKGCIVEKGLLAKRVYVYKKNVYVYTNYYNIYFIIILLYYKEYNEKHEIILQYIESKTS